uniref:Podocalyxin-like protein 2 isoform X2 n=1 Tax=Geotrypetes seraphini TaxID=260995 RepID=A0A6P8PJT6_GEOSA|nr:podocalyxin-like protein 2 isoform X2 [Geotrypetes seraphini]
MPGGAGGGPDLLLLRIQRAEMSPLHRLLVAFGPLCLCLAASEEPTVDLLTSTSLVDYAIPHLEILESSEHTNGGGREPEALPSLLQAFQGSGFSSQENEEEALILQSPQYLWEDGGAVNESNLDLGPPSGYTSPVLRGDETHSKVDLWETATLQLVTDTTDHAVHTASSRSLVEEEALIPLGQDGRAHIRKTHLHHILLADSRNKEESPISVLLTTASSRLTFETQPARRKESPKEESGSKNPSGYDPGTNVEPSLLPVFPVLLATAEESGKIQESVPEDLSKVNLGMGQLDVVPTETAKDEELPLEIDYDTVAPVGSPGFLVPWDEANQVLQTPSKISRKVMTTHTPPGNRENRGMLRAALPTEEPLHSAQEMFRLQKGQQLLSMMEGAFSRKSEQLQTAWMISLSKPNENDKHLLMTLAGEEGLIPINDVLTALEDIKRNLTELGIQNYSTITSCLSRPSPSHSDYGKLFVMLVIIGSICAMIIVSGLIYICWQRQVPKLKNMSHGEELRFVENSCHDNPTLDVTMDGQSEMQEKKASLNGGTAAAPDSWNIFLNKKIKDEVDTLEEDTHL